MRPGPARVLLSFITIGALAAAVVTSKLIFVVVALGSGVLLATSLSTSRRPLTRALQRFQNCPVEVRIWGASPAVPSGGTVVLTSVSVLGAGVHVFLSAESGAPIHVKVAQPQGASLEPNSVVIGTARYVQWNGKKIPRVDNAPAVFIARTDCPGRAEPRN